jgi:hypothetical protein
MNLGNVMTEVAAAGASAEGLTGRGFAYPQDRINPPVWLVSLPDTMTPHSTYGRGMSTMRLPCYFIVGKKQDRTSVKNLVAYLNGAGTKSLVTKIEGYAYTACDVVVVADIAVEVITVGTVDYLAAKFTLDIGGKGAAA